MNRRKAKTTRIILEAKDHEHILFVTLTYDDKYLPKQYTNPDTGEYFSSEGGVLDPRAMQLFIKRLRKRMPPRSLRYFLCGEYGDRTARPHYHILIFGLSYEQRHYIYDCWTDPDTKELMADPKYIDIQIPRSEWDTGQYISSYIMKRMVQSDDPRLEGRTPEFFRSSKGIGLNYVDQLVDCFDSVSVRSHMLATGDIPRKLVVNGKSLMLDRYMRDKILQRMGLYEEYKTLGHLRFKKEMSDMSARAVRDQKIDPSQVTNYILEKQYTAENAQAVKNIEARADIYSNSKDKI